MSVCDTCPVPGHCCRSIVLGGGSFAKHETTIEGAERFIRLAENVAGNPLPFHPLFRGEHPTQGPYWVWWCPNLNRETGRCDDYENRPMCCSDYEPMTDELCVLHEPK